MRFLAGGRLNRIGGIALIVCVAATSPAWANSDAEGVNEEIKVWTKTPADTLWSGQEITRESMGPNNAKILIKSNVTEPTLTVIRPPAGKANGTGVLVLPGGAFMALAWDLEGTEVAQWLTGRGITVFLLKYRVGPPSLKPGEAMPMDFDGLRKKLEANRKLAVADASEALRLVRKQAAHFGVLPDRIGMMGFSAGAMTTMGVVLEGGNGARPDFVAPIYGSLTPDVPVPKDAPPIFIAAAADDTTVPAGESVEIFQEWQAVHRPAELHIYEKGGHGFGTRPRGIPVDHWPKAFEAWLMSLGMLEDKNAPKTD